MIAIPWYFASKEEMSTFGWMYVLSSVISLFWMPYCGTLIDRFNRKKIFLVVTSVVGSLIIAVAALGYYLGDLPWFMVALVFIITFCNYNIHYPNLYAFMQEITEEQYYGKVTSYIEIQGQVTAVLAGAGAAMLLEGTHNGMLNIFGYKFNMGFNISSWKIHEIFALDAVTYILSFLIISLIYYVPIAKRSAVGGSVIAQLKIGYQFLVENSRIFLFGVASYSVFVAVLVTTFFIAATYVKSHLLETGDVYAASEMYYAVGAIFAGVAIRRLFNKTTIPMSIIILSTLTAILFAVLYFSNSVVIFYGMMLLLGITNAGTRIMRVTYLFTHIPNQVYGRTSSIFFLTNIMLRILLLSLFSIAFFQSGNNIIYAFGIVSIFLFITVFILVKNYPLFLDMKPKLITKKPETTS